MAVTVEERFGWTFSLDSGEALYTVRGTNDLLTARVAVETNAPSSMGGVPRSNVEIEEVGDALWHGSAKYGKTGGGSSPTTGALVVRFNTRGSTQHITQSKETIARYAPPGKTAPNFRGAIGVDQDGNVSGVDIPAAFFEFEVTRYVEASKMTGTYMGKLYELTATVNIGAFSVNVYGQPMNFAAGEVLFLGCAGALRSQGDWEMTYAFAASKNVTSITVGEITVAAKKGHEYLWMRYASDTDANFHIMKPIAAYVERVFDLKDFGQLEPT